MSVTVDQLMKLLNEMFGMLHKKLPVSMTIKPLNVVLEMLSSGQKLEEVKDGPKLKPLTDFLWFLMQQVQCH